MKCNNNVNDKVHKNGVTTNTNNRAPVNSQSGKKVQAFLCHWVNKRITNGVHTGGLCLVRCGVCRSSNGHKCCKSHSKWRRARLLEVNTDDTQREFFVMPSTVIKSPNGTFEYLSDNPPTCHLTGPYHHWPTPWHCGYTEEHSNNSHCIADQAIPDSEALSCSVQHCPWTEQQLLLLES